MAKHEYIIVNLKDLYPDPENYRFDPVKDENEAIINMVNEITDKLYVLVKSILDNEGLDPSILPNVIAYADKSDKYIVIEGNRRITALKIIKNVEIIKISPHYQKFKTLISKYDISKIPNEYYCTYYFEKSDAQFWIYLRHSGELKGEGLVSWDTLATQRFKVATGQEKADISYCVNNYLKEYKDTRLPQGTATTLKRILNSSYGKAYYGLSADNNTLNFTYDEDNTVLKLMLLIKYLGDNTINSRNANNTLDIQNWIMKLDNLYKATYEPTTDNSSTEINEETKPTSAGSNNNPSNQTGGQPPQNETENKNNHGESSQNKSESNTSNNDTQNSKESEGNTDPKNPKAADSSKSSHKSKFMDGLIYIHLDQKENRGIYNICDELVKLSTANYKDYSTYPISSGMLLRSLIEQSFKYHLKKKGHWSTLISSRKLKDDPGLGLIIGYYKTNYKSLIEDLTMARTFKILFENDSTVKDILDLSIHHPNIVNITKPELDRFVALGIVPFINYLLND